MPHTTANEPTHRPLSQAIDIFFGWDQVEHRFGVDTDRNGELHKNAVDRIVGGEIANRLLNFALRCVGAQLHITRHHARFLSLAMLVADIDLARFVAADQHGGETYLGVLQRIDLCANGRNNLVAQPVAVHEHSTAGCALKIIERSHARRLVGPQDHPPLAIQYLWSCPVCIFWDQPARLQLLVAPQQIPLHPRDHYQTQVAPPVLSHP